MEDEGLRIGQAAALVGVSVDTLRRWETEGRITLARSEGGQRLVPLGEVQRLLAERRAPQHATVASSARNQLEAVVVRVVRGAAAATVEMQAGPYRLVALTTAESVDELELEPGTPVIASVKATSVVVGLPKE
ncbi:MAG: MerR family DNA-binding transcriptional regulator [Nitriliruptorales bacterium]|nr:MerR family DNA-binding transcriptional regulator [Nitriliruptorales bacterium]